MIILQYFISHYNKESELTFPEDITIYDTTLRDGEQTPGVCFSFDEKLEIASVRLDYGDSPQLVFESLNSKGMALSTADRVRNYIVITDDANDHSEDALFEHSWLPFEATFEDRADDFDANAALNVWLANTYRNERIFDESEIYGLFKRSLRDTYKGEISPLLEDAARYARELFDDDERRSEELADLQLWISGKPKGLISEYKMFGD